MDKSKVVRYLWPTVYTVKHDEETVEPACFTYNKLSTRAVLEAVSQDQCTQVWSH